VIVFSTAPSVVKKSSFLEVYALQASRYGVKIWVACDIQLSYAWKMQAYTRKWKFGGPEKIQGMRVALNVTDGQIGHNVTCDNFFISHELGRRLLRRKITLLGIV